MSFFNQFDDYISETMKSWNSPGMAVAVIKGDAVLYRKVFGYRDVENKLPMTEDTRFAMASVTKSITAMSAALLVEDGKLEWDTPIREYMPEFILNDPYVTEHVTIRDMLSHRTGLPRHDYSAWRLHLQISEYIKRMKHYKFSASFREKFQYNNLMYYCTAWLVEKLSGIPWNTFVHQRILEPLKMSSSNLTPEPPQNDLMNAKGYRLDRDDDGNPEDLICMPLGYYTNVCPGAAGGLFSTLDDMTRWLHVHVNDGCFENQPFISTHNLKQMHLPHMVVPTGGISENMMGTTISTYGLGWFIDPYRGKTLIHHGGNLEGFSLEIGFVPQDRIGVVILTNLARTPLRDVLMYECIDRALAVKDKDWNIVFHNTYDPLIKAGSKARQTSRDEQIKDAAMTHPPEAWCGMFKADGYPDFEVRYDGKVFSARLVDSLDWSELRHYHYNVFEWHLPDFDDWMKIRFQVNDNGQIDSVSIPIEPAVDNVVFDRKPLDLPTDLLAKLSGRFDSGIEGLIFTISVRDKDVLLATSGQQVEKLLPANLTDTCVEFRVQRTRFQFEFENETITKLIIKTPDATLEAKRIE